VDEINTYLATMDSFVSLGEKLLHVMRAAQPPKERNLIIYALLRKTVKLLAAVKNLVLTGFEEEAQILVRVLIETRINFDYFLIMAKKDLYNAMGRVFAAVYLDKMKALEATDFILGKSYVDKSVWNKAKEEIKSRLPDSEFEKLKKYGFSGLPLEARASKTNNKQLYDLAYRLYSKNVHLTDIMEHLGSILKLKSFPEFEQTRIPALLQAACNCSFAVIENCNDWLGKPISLSE